jgi:hypothetical protein
MAALKIGGQYSLTASAAKLSTILSITDPSETFCKALTIKNAKGAANSMYIGGSDVTNAPANAHVELAAGESYTFYSGEGWLISTDDIYLVGTVNAANIAFINGVA